MKDTNIISEDDKKRAKILEKRISRIERMINEDFDEPVLPADELINMVDEGIITWEQLARECLDWMTGDMQWSVLAELGGNDEEDMMECDSRRVESKREPAKKSLVERFRKK